MCSERLASARVRAFKMHLNIIKTGCYREAEDVL